MNFVYGDDNRVYGKDLEEARYNALLEVFYNSYDYLKNKVQNGKNYYASDPKTAEFLETRILGGDVYIPDEEEALVLELENAYKTTRASLEICTNQKTENACKSLKFQGLDKCSYEKKWLSYIRGGNCVIDEAVIKHLLDHVQSFMMIRWNPLSVKALQNYRAPFPNPDKLTKIDMINIIHDLTYHSKEYLGGNDLISIIEQKNGKTLDALSEQDLLYYVYLLSFLAYTSQFLSGIDFQKFVTTTDLSKLNYWFNQEPSKISFVEFVSHLARVLPTASTEGTVQRIKNWAYGVISGSLLASFFFGGVSMEHALKTVQKYSGFAYNPDGTSYKEAEAARLLNEWKVSMYAQNPYLKVIPQKRAQEQYRLIRKSLGLKY